MASSLTLKLACVLLVSMAVTAPVAQAALTCSQVISSIAPCLGYLTGGALTTGCCSGIKSLSNSAQSTPDRQTACNCLKNAASGRSGINFGAASQLPGKCGVNVPYAISPSTDCSKVK